MINSTILNYRIESLIGEGGMGSVFLGTHITLGRKAAIKVLLPELARNQQIKDRFINEAKTLSKLNHQNIVILYDFADVNGNLLLVMEYVEGTPLDIVIEKITGPIPEPRCINIFEQILSGFDYAHKEGIIHRDIKPSNIILGKNDTPKILDFGIAKIIEGNARLTKTGTKMGSVLYMSPEQVLGKNTDFRSDIYSLGVTLYEMLSGKLPYDSSNESEYEIQTRIVKEPLQPIRSLNPGVSEHIENIIYKATAKDVQDRFQNCDEFRNSIIACSMGNLSAQTSKTIMQYPVHSYSNKTIIQQTTSNITDSQSSNKINKLFYIISGFIGIVIIALILIFVVFKNNSNVETQKISKDSSSNISQKKLVNLEGKYFGLINGSNWELYILEMKGSNVRGYSICYWQTKTVTENFNGTYDNNSRNLILYEEQGRGAGKFEGVVSSDLNYINGDWWRYSDNGHYSWTLQKGDKPVSQINSSTSGKYPQASDRILNYSDLSNLSKWDLKIMRNEIYARHGYIFKTDDMRNYFMNQSWYQGINDNVENVLTQIEKENISLIKKYE